jgi:hypothetical protein
MQKPVKMVGLKQTRRPFRTRPFDDDDEEYGMLDEWMLACPGK